MRHNTILVADHEERNRRNLAISLRNRGYTVLTAATPNEAIERAVLSHPHLILSDTQFPGGCGFEFCSKLRKTKDLGKVPFVFLSRDNSDASRVQAIETGATDYLIKPAYISDILARVERLIREYRRNKKRPAHRTEFQGQFGPMQLTELILNIEEKKQTGTIQLHLGEESGILYFANGHIADAELGKISGSKALYRLLTWESARFHVQVCPINRTNAFARTNAALLAQASEEHTIWECLLKHLPPLNSVSIQTRGDLIQTHLPPDADSVLRLFDGQHTLQEVLNRSPLSDRSTLDLMCELHVQGIVVSRQAALQKKRRLFPPPPAPKETLLEITGFEADSPPPPKRRRTTRRRFSIRSFNPWLRKEDVTNGVSLENLAEEIQLLKQSGSSRKGWLMAVGIVGLLGACLAVALN